MYDFNGRTVQPFLAAAPGGYRNSTSRWQTARSIWTLTCYYTVIPCVTFLMIAYNYYNNTRVTKAVFRPCSIYRSHSQASLCFYTQPIISNDSELTYCKPLLHFKRLPPQENYLWYTFHLLEILKLIDRYSKGVYSKTWRFGVNDFRLAYTTKKKFRCNIIVKLQGSSCPTIFT